ncbi:MAG: D-aminoacylase [Edaphobacter sp.]|uniref:N-acyl-D-amino-acid deacylase family protein n=1 Tax=Edaphobacter sp. TaxID=1934404 RepID=UPI002397F553|nr:D-aminoacylase [Edaphobacter sp.]MDE1176442.1 D-aminoacylase [Edaphobacter sp.]
MNRLRFVCLATLFFSLRPATAQQQVDLLIRGGSIVDGTGAPARRADVGIRGDRIVLVGDAGRTTAKRIVDARGLIVTPGFIDPHTHTADDLSSVARHRNDAYLMQGVTTVATGNDGESPLNTGATLATWQQQGIGTNAVLFIGQGTVREAVMKMSDARPNEAQLAQMKKLVADAMQQGAIGLSTGLYYAPGSYSSTEEVIELAKTAAKYGGLYDTHMRDESSYNIGLMGSVRETIRIGREAHLPVMISHIKALGADVWGQSTAVIQLIDEARASGVDITASQYPYTASGTSVTASLVPRWAEANGNLLHNLSDPALHDRLVKEMTVNLARRGGADTLLMTSAKDKSIVGKTLAQIAKERGVSPVEAAIQIDKAGGSDVASFNMKESDIEAFMKQPWVMTCSDGSEGHPRKYGTFPRKIREYVDNRHVLTLEQAIRSGTSLPAETLHIKDRGVLKIGYFADVLVFDPKTFTDVSTYQSPRQLAKGVRYLAVNGMLAVDNGALTNQLAGRPLRHQ